MIVLLLFIIIIIERIHGRQLDVKVWRAEGGGMSYHFLVEARLKLVGGRRSAGRMESGRNVSKVSKRGGMPLHDAVEIH